MNEKINTKLLKEQAIHVKEECPELFEYLVRRDMATAEFVRELYSAIPSPDDIPQIRFPFVDIAVELVRPNKDCGVCEDEESLWLTPALRAKLCDICKNGVYLRKTGIGSLAELHGQQIG